MTLEYLPYSTPNPILSMNPEFLNLVNPRSFRGTKEEDFKTVIPSVCNDLIKTFGPFRRTEILKSICISFGIDHTEAFTYYQDGLKQSQKN